MSVEGYVYEPTGLEELGTESVVNVYPNPNDGRFYLELIGFEGVQQLEVVYSKSLNVHHAYLDQVDLSLSAGVYFVRVRNDKGVVSKKIVVGQ